MEGPPGVRAPTQKFRLVKSAPVQQYASAPSQPASDADRVALEELAKSATIAQQITGMKSGPVDSSLSQDLPAVNASTDVRMIEDEVDVAEKAPPPAAAAASSQQPIGMTMQEAALMNGYRPGFGGLPRPDMGRIPRADGRLYSNQNPEERVYENKDNAFGKEWLRRQVSYRQALARDPLYHMATQVAGRTNRRALDLIEDPLEYAQPELMRPDPRLTVKDAYNPVVPGADGRVSTAAGIPGFYSKYKIINQSIPERYRTEYKRLTEEAAKPQNAANKAALLEEAFSQVLKGLVSKWNSYARDNRLPGVPEVQATNQSSPDEQIAYSEAMKQVRRNLLQRMQEDLAVLYSLPVTRLTDENYLRLVSLRQNVAELTISIERRWIDGAYEDLPGYEVLRRVFESGSQNDIAVINAFNDWDRLFNNGLFAKQRGLAILAESRRKEDEDVRRDALVQLLEGKGATSLDQKNAPPGRPEVNTRWMTLPENLGVIVFRENLQAAVDQSLSDLAGFSQKGHIPLMDIITEPEVSSFFFDLVACNLRIYEVMAPRRNEEHRLLKDLRQRRLELLLKFTLLEFRPETGSLGFSDQAGAVLNGVGTLRRAFQGKGLRKRGSPSLTSAAGSIAPLGMDPAEHRTVYSGPDSERYKYSQLKNGSEIQEFERSKDFFRNFA